MRFYEKPSNYLEKEKGFSTLKEVSFGLYDLETNLYRMETATLFYLECLAVAKHIIASFQGPIFDKVPRWTTFCFFCLFSIENQQVVGLFSGCGRNEEITIVHLRSGP